VSSVRRESENGGEKKSADRAALSGIGAPLEGGWDLHRKAGLSSFSMGEGKKTGAGHFVCTPRCTKEIAHIKGTQS